MDYISTSSLANELDMKPADLFDKLKTLGWIERKSDKWILTETGKQHGGQTRNNPKFGDFVVWPENISLDKNGQTPTDKPKLLNSTAIGDHFKVSNQRMNLIFAELGWIEKAISGWVVTKLGKTVGGRQFEDETKGNTYVKFANSILHDKSLLRVFNDTPTEKETPKIFSTPQQPTTTHSSGNFREKFPATLRTKDGHMVRSRAEVIIDNALYDYKLAHAYERKLPIEEDLYSDFFIPTENVYIEFWGMEDEPKYAERKKIKKEIYQKYDFKLIELNDSDISNLDDHLPKKLLKYNIKVY